MRYKKKKPYKKTIKPKKRVVKDSTKKKISDSLSKSIAEGKNISKEKSNKVTSSRFSKKCWYHSPKNNDDFYADSLAEMFNMIKLDNNVNVKRWTKKHGIRVPYVYRGKNHYCVPDFLIETQDGSLYLEEIKGKVTEKELVKKEAIQKYCDIYGYIFLFTTTVELDKNKEYTEFLRAFKKSRKRK